ncbi:MAG: hypothetical protein ACT4P6_10615 [Gemmatimonadaceae bacterium]
MATIIGPSKKPNAVESSDRAWQALGSVGVVFIVIGLTDLVLAWVPPRFGNPDWEFATVTAMFNNLPVPSMGIGLALAGAIAVESPGAKRLVAVMAGLLAAWSLVAAVFFGLTLPLAWSAMSEPAARQTLITSIVKTVVQFVVYTLFFGWVVRFSRLPARSHAAA